MTAFFAIRLGQRFPGLDLAETRVAKTGTIAMPDDDPTDDHLAANRKLQELFGVPRHLAIEDSYIQQVASIGLNTGKLTREQIVELCGAVMGHLARRERG